MDVGEVEGMQGADERWYSRANSDSSEIMQAVWVGDDMLSLWSDKTSRAIVGRRSPGQGRHSQNGKESWRPLCLCARPSLCCVML